jgi:putative transcriptional regulator
MKDELFSELLESANQALEHSAGRRELRTTLLPKPPPKLSKDEITGIRMSLKCSQAVFAAGLNVSIKTVQAWEQGQRIPSDAALKLLSIAKKKPEILFEAT